LIPDSMHWLGAEPAVTVLAKKRFDGLVVTRKGSTHTTNPTNPSDISKYDKYLFETLAAKNGYLVMLVAIDNNSSPPVRMRDYNCARYGQQKQECINVLRSYRTWVESVLGTELTTFNIN